jgi:acyl-homoserine lactone acylase PvdQ
VALIANDMHLDLGVPAVWYPARLRVTGNPAIDVTGVTLPGTPAVAAGSNGQVAWGFTNSYGDFADARWGKCASVEFGVRRETIAVKGEKSVEVVYRDVGAGVVLDGEGYAEDVASGECLQAAWLATRTEATNFGLLDLKRARGIDDVLAMAPDIGFRGRTWSSATPADASPGPCWVVCRAPRPDRLFGRSSIAMPSTIHASPIHPWAGCGPQTSAWSPESWRGDR